MRLHTSFIRHYDRIEGWHKRIITFLAGNKLSLIPCPKFVFWVPSQMWRHHNGMIKDKMSKQRTKWAVFNNKMYKLEYKMWSLILAVITLHTFDCVIRYFQYNASCLVLKVYKMVECYFDYKNRWPVWLEDVLSQSLGKIHRLLVSYWRYIILLQDSWFSIIIVNVKFNIHRDQMIAITYFNIFIQANNTSFTKFQYFRE